VRRIRSSGNRDAPRGRRKRRSQGAGTRVRLRERPSRRLLLALRVQCGKARIERETIDDDNHQKRRSCENREIDARLVQKGPETRFRREGMYEDEVAAAEQNRHLRREERDHHRAEERPCREPCDKADKKEPAAEELRRADKRSEQLRRRQANLGEATR